MWGFGPVNTQSKAARFNEWILDRATVGEACKLSTPNRSTSTATDVPAVDSFEDSVEDSIPKLPGEKHVAKKIEFYFLFARHVADTLH